MGSKRTRSSSRNKKAAEPSVNGAEPNSDTNANAIVRETEPNIEASGAAGAETGTDRQTGGSSSNKVRGTKKKTSPVWKHFSEVSFEENVDGMVVLKQMAECNYCDEVLCAPSQQGFVTTYLQQPKVKQAGHHAAGR